jgi:uncharacterized membrane protein
MPAIGMAIALAAGSGYGVDPAPVQVQKQEVIYGSQLMTNQERNDFRAKMRNAKTAQEREQIRLEHHKAMQERAKAQGKTLPDMPPAMGAGMGPGGGGMGSGGGGMGPGGGRGR